MNQTRNRPAVTLTEVLIAIFLMGIGLMAILSLFPLGASQMAQVLQDQRAAEAATTAAGFARVIWKQTCDADPNVGQAKFYDISGNPQCQQQFLMAMDNPNVGVPPANAISAMPAMQRTGLTVSGGSVSSATGPSYPVFVDPIGFQANAALGADNVWWLPQPSSGQTWRIPRRSLYVRQPGTMVTAATPWVALNSMGTLPMLRQFTLMDDMTFNYAGTPDLTGDQTTPPSAEPTTQPVRRQGRYSWAFMFRRANNADRAAVDITTILYSGRSIDVASQETAYYATVQFPPASGPGVTPSTKTVTLVYGAGAKPALRRGNWILDATLNDASGNLLPQGVFYRVVNVDDSAVTNPPSVTLELQTPIMGDPYGSTPRQPTTRVFVVMDKVIEVFTKKDVSNVAPPMPY